jgi:hypothetical protein
MKIINSNETRDKKYRANLFIALLEKKMLMIPATRMKSKVKIKKEKKNIKQK